MIDEVEAHKGNAIDKIKHYLWFTLNFSPSQLNLCFTHLATELYAGGENPAGIEKIYKKLHDFISKILEMGREEGTFRKDIEPDILAANLIGALEGNLIHWKFNMRKYKGDAYARSFEKFYLFGIEQPGVGNKLENRHG
jgi:hypothetical protein